MSDSEKPEQPQKPDALAAAEQSLRRARVFGDVLPDATRDDRDHGAPEDGGTDDWLRRQVPPHHG